MDGFSWIDGGVPPSQVRNDAIAETMRRDDRPFDPAEGTTEIDAIAAQWTQKWIDEGGPSLEIEKIKRREEFRIIDPYIRKLPSGARLLDGGCGMGQWTAYYTGQGYPTVGLDVSAPTIAQLQGLFPDCEFVTADIRESGLPDASFDAYFSWGTFEHFEEGFARVVGEANRLLKPGGRLFVSTPFDNLRMALKATYFTSHRVSHKQPPTRFYQWRLTRAELAQILAGHGFDVEKVHIISKRQGVLRTLHHNLGLPHSAFFTRGLAFALAPLLPATVFGHMILAVAAKPFDNETA